MDPLVIYAIAAGCIFAGLFSIRTLAILGRRRDSFSVFFSRHLTLPFFIHQHRLWGPWTRVGVLLHISYAAINIFLVFFRVKSSTGAGHRAGKLALVNLIFPLSAIHLSYLADVLGIRWKTCRRIHRATGWMGVALLSFHIIMAVQAQGFMFPLHDVHNVFTMLAAVSLGLLALLSIPWFRQLSHEIFLRGHQILAGLFVYGTWQHIPSQSHSSRVFLLVALGTFALTLLLEMMTLLYRNGLFTGRGFPRAIVSFSVGEATKAVAIGEIEKNGPLIRAGDLRTLSARDVVLAVHIRLLLPHPIKVEAGQYVNIWIPSVSLLSAMQTHPFTVVSWSGDTQGTIDLLVQPRRGLTADLLRYAPTALYSSVSFLALFTGPHGISEDVGNYESILVVASKSGIAVAIPYLKKIIYGYNTCTAHVRRLHLVWQIGSIDEMTPAIAVLNNLLKEDTMDQGYILHISVYVSKHRHSVDKNEYFGEKDEHCVEKHKESFEPKEIGEHKRVYVYPEAPNYKSIIAAEASGERIPRLPNTADKPGRTLVMVSATNGVRHQIREIVRDYLHQDVKLTELEYQPSADTN